MRRALNALYGGAAWLAALFMIALLVAVLLSIAGREFNFHVKGTDAYAGYCMAASAFLALAHTLKRGEHIRVNLLLERFGKRICEAYYAKAGDKRAAMRALLELRDPKAILAESGYGRGFSR